MACINVTKTPHLCGVYQLFTNFIRFVTAYVYSIFSVILQKSLNLKIGDCGLYNIYDRGGKSGFLLT